MKGERLNKIFNNMEECPSEYKGKLPNRFVDIKNEIYNHLEVLYLVGFRKGRSEWLCKCHNCGRYVIVNSHNLRSGHTKSCGCLISEKIRIDLTGNQYGFLRVIKYDKSVNENPYWIVRCENCGKEYSASGDAIKRQKSCGCIQSKGELIITEILLKNNVDFKTQVTFEGLVGKNNNKLRFDFGIYYDGKLSHLIEMQGLQHFRNAFNMSTEEYEYRLSLDEKKRKWCQENKIPLVEIKYNEDITLEKLMVYHTKGIIEEDFIQYKKPTKFITNTYCDLKCERECGKKCCGNGKIFHEPNLYVSFETIIKNYLNNNISESITFGGLEQFDEFDQLKYLISSIRKVTPDPIIIYTGYNEDEIADKIDILKYYENIVVKFGRYIPDRPKKFDELLGVELASDNQYAKVISLDAWLV